METNEYHSQAQAARQERDRVIATARQAERRGYLATRCGCRYPAECRCADRVEAIAAYSIIYHIARAAEDRAEREYQANLRNLAAVTA